MEAKFTIGIDEAGRGPLAGPVSVGVVCTSSTFDINYFTGVKDSKTLSEKKREELYVQITQAPDLQWTVSMVSAAEIDRVGIQAAIRSAIKQALSRIDVDPTQTLIQLDGGLYAPSQYVHQDTIVKGDAKLQLIGAASIVAKVTRDRYMRTQHEVYPEYGFDKHKGYGTLKHRTMLKQIGLSPLHRRTYCH